MPLARPAAAFFLRLARRLTPHPAERDKMQANVEALRTVPVFSGLPRRTLGYLAEAVHRRTYRADESVYHQDDPALGFYVIASGRVRLLVSDETDVQREVGTLERGALLGAGALFGEVRRLETAEAATETRLLGFYRPDLLTMTKRHPRAASHVALALGRHLAAEHRTTYRCLADACGGPVAARQRMLSTTPPVPSDPFP